MNLSDNPILNKSDKDINTKKLIEIAETVQGAMCKLAPVYIFNFAHGC